ncbi:unnamed protein product, partial [Pleuronectes platessa]
AAGIQRERERERERGERGEARRRRGGEGEQGVSRKEEEEVVVVVVVEGCGGMGGGRVTLPQRERVCARADKPAVGWPGQELCDRDKSRVFTVSTLPEPLWQRLQPRDFLAKSLQDLHTILSSSVRLDRKSLGAAIFQVLSSDVLWSFEKSSPGHSGTVRLDCRPLQGCAGSFSIEPDKPESRRRPR